MHMQHTVYTTYICLAGFEGNVAKQLTALLYGFIEFLLDVSAVQFTRQKQIFCLVVHPQTVSQLIFHKSILQYNDTYSTVQ